MFTIRFDPDRWSPRGADHMSTTRLETGQIVVWERKAHRVTEVRERGHHEWPERFTTKWANSGMPDPATWGGRPMIVVLASIDQPEAKPLHLCTPASHFWDTLPEHFSICRLCHELPPCTHVHTEAVMERASERLAEEMAILPGSCHHCKEPITSRQKSVSFTGPNLIRPDLGDGSAVFHLRGRCRYAVESYDKRWAEATGNKRRFYCEGHQTVHLDKSMSCTELAECPGDVSHRAREWHHPDHRSRYPRESWCWCLAGTAAEGQLNLKLEA